MREVEESELITLSMGLVFLIQESSI